MISFTQLAKEKVLSFIQDACKDMSLRIHVKERTDSGFKYAFSLEETSAERSNDITVSEGSFLTRIDPESSKWLQNATVDWSTEDNKAGFAVQNPNSPVSESLTSDEPKDPLKKEIIEQIRTIFDPEIPINIYELGLIYDIDLDEEKNALVTMTLTAPNCPAAEILPEEVRVKVEEVPGVKSSEIKLTWEPPWDKDMMSEAAKLQLGI